MKNSKKIGIFILLIIVVLIIINISLLFYNLFNNKENKETSNKGVNTYIGINGCFLGSYEDGKWYNAQDINENNLKYKEFSINDIKQFSKMYYHKSEIIDNNVSNNTIEVKDYIGNEGTLYDTFRFKSYYEIVETIGEHIAILTNNKENIYTTESTRVDVSQKYDNIINEIKVKNNVSKANTELLKVTKVDYDKDNKEETILIVTNKRDELGYNISDNGVCCLVILIDDNGEYEVIHKYILTSEQMKDVQGVEDQYYIYSTVICDLNYDGKNEMCIEAGIWDIPIKLVYEFDKEFKLVLKGEYPW